MSARSRLRSAVLAGLTGSLALAAGAATAQQVAPPQMQMPGMQGPAGPQGKPMPQRGQLLACPSLQDLGMATPANVKPQTKAVEDPRIVAKVGKGWTQTSAPGTFFLRQVNFTVTDPRTISVQCDYGNGLILSRSMLVAAQACQWAPVPKHTLTAVSHYYGPAKTKPAGSGAAGAPQRLDALMEDSRGDPGRTLKDQMMGGGRPGSGGLDKAERCIFFAKIETREGLDNSAFCTLQCQGPAGPQRP